MSSAAPVDSARVIADLRELAERTSDEHGAQRLCWTPGWREARSHLTELLEDLGVEPEVDEAGNLWARLEGSEPQAEAVVVGSHLDSVPNGGWLDGALGVIAGVGILRSVAESGSRPRRSLVLVDWADEEGARFGRSLFGSSAFAGTLVAEEAAHLRDAGGELIADVLAADGVDLSRAAECGSRRAGLGSYLELHIEQGPTMQSEGLRAAAVLGCTGVERVRFVFTGQTSHAGTTPMDRRRDAGLAAADAALRIERIPDEGGGVATTGELRFEPGFLTAIAGRATLSVDLRHPEAEPLARMLDAARAACADAAAERGCSLAEDPVWGIEPTAFDAGLVFAARKAVGDVTGEPASITSGALHDAAEVSRVLPAVMVFAPSKDGISHARGEDTDEADLRIAIDAFATLAQRELGR